MPFVFAIIGVSLIASGVRGQAPLLLSLVKADFTGEPSYTNWGIGILLVGVVGYVDDLRTISRMFMAILVLGLLWSNKDLFSAFTSETASTAPETSPTTGNGGSSSLSSTLSGVAKGAAAIIPFL